MIIDKVYYLPENLEQILGTHFYAKGVSGDNSCFYHSVLYNISSEYKLETIEKKQKQMVRDFRDKLYSYITHEYWEKELSGFIDKNKLLLNLYDYDEWAGSTEWKVVVDYMKINIIMFRQSTDSIYCGWGIDNFNPSYKTIFILNVNDVHYDPIIFLTENKIQTIFKYSSPIINKIVNHGKKYCLKI